MTGPAIYTQRRTEITKFVFIRLFFFQMLGVFLHELLYAPGRVNEFLLTGEEWMTGRANFNPHFPLDRTELNLTATGTGCNYFIVLRMDSFFHWYAPSLKKYGQRELCLKNNFNRLKT